MLIMMPTDALIEVKRQVQRVNEYYMKDAIPFGPMKYDRYGGCRRHPPSHTVIGFACLSQRPNDPKILFKSFDGHHAGIRIAARVRAHLLCDVRTVEGNVRSIARKPITTRDRFANCVAHGWLDRSHVYRFNHVVVFYIFHFICISQGHLPQRSPFRTIAQGHRYGLTKWPLDHG
jgi:hypothetical protein